MKSLYVVLISLTMCSLIYSQEDTTKHNWALSFGIGNDFTLTNFNMDIAIKKILDKRNQLRLFFSPRVSIRNDDQTTTGSSQTSETNIINYSFGAGVDYLFILLTNGDVNMFCGSGLIFTVGNNNIKTTTKSLDGYISTNEDNSPLTGFGLRGTVGVEWKVNEKIGIHSEYLLTGQINWYRTESKSSYNGVDSPISTRKAYTVSLGTTVLFGLSIYF